MSVMAFLLVNRARSAERFPREIWVLGFVSLFMDFSSEMIHALLPLYITGALGASALTYGVIEGLAESLALVTKFFSGALSDWLGKRKALSALGYSLSAVTKPIFPLSTTIGGVVFARFVDRIGKGIRGAPRDAMVAEFAPGAIRGACFGLRQSLDTVGAFLGPLVASSLLWIFVGDIRLVFWIACIPAFCSASLIIFGVSEPETPNGQIEDKKRGFNWGQIKLLPKSYWMLVLASFILTLARFSEGFLILQAQEVGIQIAWVPFVLVVMNVVFALSAYVAGMLADRINRNVVLLFGILLLAGSDILLGLSNSASSFFAGICLWGLHLGFTQGVVATLVADLAPKGLLGTAFGFLNLCMGLALLLASLLAGFLWDVSGGRLTFMASALIASLAFGLFYIVAKQGSGGSELLSGEARQ